MKLLLIRHGQSEGNVDRSVYFTTNDHDVKLTDKGVRQAVRAGQELNAMDLTGRVELMCSPYRRTRDTRDAILEQMSNKPSVCTENPMLREQEYKIFADNEDHARVIQEKQAFSSFYYRFKNAESQADVYQRVYNILTDLRLRKLEGTAPDTMIIVTHEVVIRCFMMILDNIKVEDSHFHVKNCAINVRSL